ncbi:putative nucleic acid-binding protein, contains PIN domain [Candidatus Fervidibacteria bacterium JGI MDM2 JNZ-1-D12]
MDNQIRTECVTDCSIVVKWELPSEPFEAEAMELFRDWQVGAVRVIVPTILLAEIGSAFLRAARRGRLPFTNALQSVLNLIALPFTLVDIAPLTERAFNIAHQYQQGFFDCLYVALAEARGAEFWTGDQRLFNALHNAFPFIHWIGDYKPKRQQP